MSYFWMQFSDGSRGTIQAPSEAEAKSIAHERKGIEPYRTAVIPYPASPVIHQTEGNTCPPFCHQPDKCAGRSCCPRPRACDD